MAHKKLLVLLVLPLLVAGCMKKIGNIPNPIVYEFDAAKATAHEIYNAFGDGDRTGDVSRDNVNSIAYSCSGDMPVTICIIQNGVKVCRPCGYGGNPSEINNNVTFEFQDGVLTEARFDQNEKSHPLISPKAGGRN